MEDLGPTPVIIFFVVSFMSLFGGRECGDDGQDIELNSSSSTYTNENTCQRFYNRFMTCLRESQEIDVLYDCRSRKIDLQECSSKHKQSLWLFRETVVSMRKEKELRAWLAKYDEDFGFPPLLEAARKVQVKVGLEGGVDVLNPTHFKDPDLWIPFRKPPEPRE